MNDIELCISSGTKAMISIYSRGQHELCVEKLNEKGLAERVGVPGLRSTPPQPRCSEVVSKPLFPTAFTLRLLFIRN